jgi:hypothetical protein
MPLTLAHATTADFTAVAAPLPEPVHANTVAPASVAVTLVSPAPVVTPTAPAAPTAIAAPHVSTPLAEPSPVAPAATVPPPTEPLAPNASELDPSTPLPAVGQASESGSAAADSFFRSAAQPTVTAAPSPTPVAPASAPTHAAMVEPPSGFPWLVLGVLGALGVALLVVVLVD